MLAPGAGCLEELQFRQLGMGSSVVLRHFDLGCTVLRLSFFGGKSEVGLVLAR